MSWENQTDVKPEDIKQKMEFKKLKDVKQSRGIKILSYGNFSTGKTHFALNCPEPIYIIDTENGAPPLADKFPNVNVINICNMEGEDVDEKDEVRNFENFQEVVKQLTSLPDDQVGTIVVDSVSDIWTWCQGYCKVKVFKLNIEDRLAQRFDWGIINNTFKKIIMKLVNKNCNVIFTAREGDIYDNASGPSGRVKPETQKKLPFLVDIVLRHQVKFINKIVTFYAQIEKCRMNGALTGKTIDNITLSKLKELIDKHE